MRRPKNRKVDESILDQGGVTPLRALTVALANRSDRKEDRKYQQSLGDRGMFEGGGGRANVPSSTSSKAMPSPTVSNSSFLMKPRARPARIEQEAAEAAAVERGNREARRRASDTQNFRDGGSIRGCKSIQSSGTGFSGEY